MSTLDVASADPKLTDPMAPEWYRVRRTRRETHDTFSLELAPDCPEVDVRFLPGQFNMLYVFGLGEVPISISGDASRFDALIHTTRVAGSVTRAMSKLTRGETIGVRGPFGTAWPVDEAVGKDVVIVAGGIGLAPLRPVLYHLLRRREDFQRIVVRYGARSPEDLLFRDELKAWRGRWDMDVNVTVDRGIGRWHGNVGVVPNLIPSTTFDPGNTVAMICGPEVMMRYTVTALRQKGLGSSSMFLSMERNMKCAVGLCGHCQFGPKFVCKDGPVFRYDTVEALSTIREL